MPAPGAGQSPATPSYAAPLVKRSGTTMLGSSSSLISHTNNNSSLPVTPKTPSSTYHHATAAIDDGGVGNASSGGASAGSPFRFMQGTNSWKKKAMPSDRAVQENNVMRAFNWK
jgi:hypothetical protein